MSYDEHRVRPAPSDEYLGNPHKGCCTFQHFNGDELFPGETWSEHGPLAWPPAKTAVIDGYLPSTVAYCRWYWNVLEKQEGQYDFSMIENSLETCRQRGQTLAVRLMPFGTGPDDALPAWYPAGYPTRPESPKRHTLITPIYDSPEYLRKWGDLIRAFGARFDGHPLLESFDMAYIGPWGEGAGECSAEQCRRFAEVYRQALPRTIRLAMIGSPQMNAGIATGAGWRCDCFGDLRNAGDRYVPKPLSWNHMYDAYPRQVAEGGAADAWKTAPVHLETCWVPMTWYRLGFDIDFIIEQGLKYHATYFMPKYTRLPEKWMDKLAAFCRRLGYRFIWRQSQLPYKAARGGSFRLMTWIENVGVAPPYRRYDLALRLRQGDREHFVILDDIDTTRWLPGDIWLDRTVRVPPEVSAGWAELSAALVEKGTTSPRVRFAVKERYPDGWVDLGGIEIVNPDGPPL